MSLSCGRLGIDLTASYGCGGLILVDASDMILVRVLLLNRRVLQVVIRHEGLSVSHRLFCVLRLDQVLLNRPL